MQNFEKFPLLLSRFLINILNIIYLNPSIGVLEDPVQYRKNSPSLG